MIRPLDLTTDSQKIEWRQEPVKRHCGDAIKKATLGNSTGNMVQFFQQLNYNRKSDSEKSYTFKDTEVTC